MRKRPHPSVVTRAINRYAAAVGEKVFDGSIPWDCEAAIEMHAAIDLELHNAEMALRRLINR